MRYLKFTFQAFFYGLIKYNENLAASNYYQHEKFIVIWWEMQEYSKSS